MKRQADPRPCMVRPAISMAMLCVPPAMLLPSMRRATAMSMGCPAEDIKELCAERLNDGGTEHKVLAKNETISNGSCVREGNGEKACPHALPEFVCTHLAFGCTWLQDKIKSRSSLN
jgi:hypothetical protein